jgi:hypothetical protein
LWVARPGGYYVMPKLCLKPGRVGLQQLGFLENGRLVLIRLGTTTVQSMLLRQRMLYQLMTVQSCGERSR